MLVFNKLELGICVIILDVLVEFSLVFQNTEAAFGRCSTKIIVQQDDVMKYSFYAPVVKIRKVLHPNLLETEIYRRYFSNNLTTSSEQCYTSRWLLWADLHGWSPKAAAKIIFKVLMVTNMFYFLPGRHVKVERTFMDCFKCTFRWTVWARRISFRFCSKIVFQQKKKKKIFLF